MTVTFDAGVISGNTTLYTGTGDIRTADEKYTVLKWIWRTGDGTTIWNAAVDGVSVVEYLVVGAGGGGGGGIGTGGGGAGRLKENSATKNFAVAGPLTVTVGNGGTCPGATYQNGGNGGNSVFSSVISIGGGGGGGTRLNGSNGGTGGGGGGYDYSEVHYGGTGDYAGGDCFAGRYSGGGGGGTSADGQDGQSDTVPGNGGAGTASSITGASVTYGVGGGGGCYDGHLPNPTYAGTDNLGNGGSGSATNGAAVNRKGGTGIVIIRYLTLNNYSGIGMGSANMMCVGC